MPSNCTVVRKLIRSSITDHLFTKHSMYYFIKVYSNKFYTKSFAKEKLYHDHEVLSTVSVV